MPGSAPLSLYVAVPPTAGGGLERSTWLLLRGFDRSLVRPTLVLTHTRTTNARLIDTLPADIEVIEPAKRGFLDQRRLVGVLRRVYEDRRPDVVMGRATYANLLALLARRGARHRPAVIATEHATPDLARQPRNLWMLWLGRQVYRDAVAVVAVGAGLGRAVASSFRVQPDRLSVIPNAYDPDLDAIVSTADAASQRAAGDAPVIVFVGRLSHEKGVDDLIRALPMVRVTTPARLVVIGDGPLRLSLEALAEKVGVAESVDFAGYVSQPFRQMAAADVVAAPSHFEAASLVLVEAMRSGAAIVAADCDWGPREVVTDGHDGLLVPVSDPSALAAAILRVLAQPDLSARPRHAARETSEHYSPERNVTGYTDLIVGLRKPVPPGFVAKRHEDG